MGQYTEIFVNVDLKPETPEEVLAVLRAMCGGEDQTPLDGKPWRWRALFSNGSYYVPKTSCAKLIHHKDDGFYSLLGKGDIKNYEREIEQFFEWLIPYIDAFPSEFIGYKRYEELDAPDLLFMPPVK